MKFFVSTFLVALLSFAVCLYLPWWTIAIVGLLVTALIPQKPFFSFLSGFIGVFILWSVLSGMINYNNQELLARKVSILILGMENPLLLVLLTGLIGGLIAGLGALAGSFLRKSNSRIAPEIPASGEYYSVENQANQS